LTYINKITEGRSSNAYEPSPLRRFILAPSSHAIYAVHSWFDRDIASIVRGPRLASQNAQLSLQVATLTQQYREISQEANENVRLRTLLGFKAHSLSKLLSAEVIAVKPTPARDTIMLMRGAKDHVQRLMPVVSDTGALVGQVIDETYDTCDVLLLTDDESSAATMVYPIQPGDKLSEGICRGERIPQLNLTDLPQDADIVPGQSVYTSGEGGVYPRGILIGTVASYQILPAVGLKTAVINPAVDFNHLQDVFVLLSTPVNVAPAPTTQDKSTEQVL
jgi:rod shape-determining protein MreC